MTIPKLGPAEIAWIVEGVETYIQEQRDKFRLRSTQLTAKQRAAMIPFFDESILDSVRAHVLSTGRINNPPFYGQLEQMGITKEALPDFQIWPVSLS